MKVWCQCIALAFASLFAEFALAQSQSQAGLRYGRQLIDEGFYSRSNELLPGGSKGLFFHHQFKGRNGPPSHFGLMTSIDYVENKFIRALGGRSLTGMVLPSYDIRLEALSTRIGLVVNFDLSRQQNFQVYLQAGLHLLHELNSTSTIVYNNGRRGETQELQYFEKSPGLHNIYAAIDLRYRVAGPYFLGVTAQFSTLNLVHESTRRPVSYGVLFALGYIFEKKPL